MASKDYTTYVHDKNWDRMLEIPATVNWDDPISMLMAGPNQRQSHPLSDDIRDAVRDGIMQLNDKDRFLIEAVYVWGRSYSQIAEMMGYNSKGTSHYAIKKAERNLGDILKADSRIIRLLKGNGMNNIKDWADGAWKNLRYFEKNISTEMFDDKLFEVYFMMLREAVQDWGVDENADIKLYDLCTRIGVLAAQGLGSHKAWDTEAMQTILTRKQHDYGHDNINAFGIIGVAVRISDKIARYKNLVTKSSNGLNESLEDTLVDMVGYAVIARMLEDGTFDLPLVMGL